MNIPSARHPSPVARLLPLRTLLGVILVLLALVPALLVAWVMRQAGTQSAEAMAAQILAGVASKIQSDTERQLELAQNALNAIVPRQLTERQAERARLWLRDPSTFEPMAFAVTRQSPDTPMLYFANLRGEYFSVEKMPEGARVAHRTRSGSGRRVWLASESGDRSRPLGEEIGSFEPRTRPWYQGALSAGERVFSPPQVAPDGRQLMITLSQPVYDPDGGAAGVFAVDLRLGQIDTHLRSQPITARGAAFVIDESDRLIAGSAGDPLVVREAGQEIRRSPADSANPVIRAGFAALLAARQEQSSDSVAVDRRLRRFEDAGQSLMLVQRPFGQMQGLKWTLVVVAPDQDFMAVTDQAWRVSAFSIAGLAGVAVLLSIWIAHVIGRRLLRLSHAAEAIGRGEVPSVDSATRILEVHALSQVLHDSAQELRQYRARVQADALALQRANETLEERVAARTAELEASREEALAAAQAKAAFLATMSHEIRTPLNGVVGMATLLAETPLNAEQRDYLQTIRLSSDQLLAVINDVLDFSKIESGRLDLEQEPLSVRAAVEEACDISASRAREKGLELIIDIPQSGDEAVPDAIAGDVTRLRQVLINLINNAVKFTEQGEVAVQVRGRGRTPEGRERLEFRVIDSGIGIAPDRAQSLFEAFTQADVSTTRKYGGTGLGLAICKRLVELMGGEIGVESVPGHGSTFWFTLEAAPAQLAPTVSAAQTASLQGRKALVIDDHATNVRVLVRQLELWGMDATGLESGAAALEWLAAQAAPPDLIITDMHMPGMDGVMLARLLREHARWAGTPLVLLSSGFMPASDESARLFDARLLKPARQGQLFDTLARCLRGDRRDALAPASAAPGPKRHATVLVADDNAVNLKVACAMVAKLGYEVLTAVDGREAIDVVDQAHARGRPVAAVLMDVNMPRVDGFEATRDIQARWGDAAPPIIALTAAASSEDRARCLAAGMDDYLTKPLQVAALALALERWVVVPEEAQTRDAEGDPAHARTSADAAALPWLDPARLEEFREFDDEALSLTREVIDLFIADGPRRLQAIEAALQAADTSALARAAHALKGACGNIGAQALQSWCAVLEAQASEGHGPADPAAVQAQLQSHWTSTREALLAWLSRLNP